MTTRQWWVLVAVLSLALAACASDSSDDEAAGDDRPTIVATTSIWADVVSNLVCDGSARVDVIMADGSDPHRYELSLSDRARLEGADLVIANGLGLEEAMEDSLEAAASDGVAVVSVGELADPLPYATGGHDDEEHGSLDPHVWFDPARVGALLAPLGEEIVAATGIERSVIEGCIDDYRARLDELDASILDRVEAVPEVRRVLVTNHDSLGYFADRYGFEVVGTVLPSPSGLAETNPAALEALAEDMAANGVAVIFSEEHQAADDAEALARRVGNATVIELSTAGLGEWETYLALLDGTTDVITDALR